MNSFFKFKFFKTFDELKVLDVTSICLIDLFFS
jgi:hypothetical protein